MAKIARVGDKTIGSFSSDHCHHYDHDGDKIHTSGTVEGNIQSNGGTVYIEGIEVATAGSPVIETDIEDTGNGNIGPGSGEIYVNGKKIAKIGDLVISHTGKPATIIGNGPGSVDVS
jgi:uncharacterized Zn-binding protein involved in type VI secretion